MSECQQGTCDDMKKTVDKKTFWTVIGFFVVIALAFATAYGVTKRDISKNTTDIAVDRNTMKTEFGHVKELLHEIKDSQLTKEDVHEAITKRLRGR